MSETNWYSANNEIFNYSEIDDAVSDVVDASAAVTGDILTVWRGEAVVATASDFAPNIWDCLNENAYEEFEDLADSWPGATWVQGAELDANIRAVIDAWADKHDLQPTFSRIKNVVPVRVRLTSDDGDWEGIDEGDEK